MPVLRFTLDNSNLQKGALVEFYDDDNAEGVDGVAAGKTPPIGRFLISVPAVKGHIDRLMVAPTRTRAAANNQVGADAMDGPIIRPNREMMMIMGRHKIRTATRFEAKKVTLLIAPGESNVKPREIILPSRWWVCDYDLKSSNMLHYGLVIEVNERNPIDALAHGVDPMVAEWVYGNCDPGGRVCWGQSNVKINQQPAAEIDSLFFGTPFNSHLHYRSWPKDGDIPRDLDQMEAPRLSAVMRGEASIVQPKQRPQPAANVAGTQQTGNVGGIAGQEGWVVINADGTIAR